jgi:peptidyl-prolyl cis-trans isomerase B (cyclophilin B)
MPLVLTRARAGVPALLLLPLVLTAACGSSSDDKAAAGGTSATSCAYPTDGSSATVTPPPAKATATGKVEVDLQTTIGPMHLTLDADAAPCTVNSILSLVDQGYYDDTTCHRMTTYDVFKVLQCGDPTGTGSGTPGYSSADEYKGDEKYTAGTLAMAHTQAPDSNGSQFFIVYGDTQLDPAYTVFGTVDAGTVKEIAKAAKAGVTPVMGAQDGTPKTTVTIEKAARG